MNKGNMSIGEKIFGAGVVSRVVVREIWALRREALRIP